MRRCHFRIAVAILVNVLFLATAVAHACIGTVAARASHHHGGIETAAIVQHSHAEGQDENCRSVRDRFISLAPRASETNSLVGSLDIIPTVGEPPITAIQMFTAERPPGTRSTADDQPPLYITNSVFRI